MKIIAMLNFTLAAVLAFSGDYTKAQYNLTCAILLTLWARDDK